MRQDSRTDQRCQDGDGTGGIAARVADALCLNHSLALAGAHFRKTKDPLVVHAVGGGGVNDAWLVARQSVNHGHGLFGRIIVQAQNNQIHLGHQLTFGFRIFAFFWGNAHQLNLRHGQQALADQEPGGTRFAIDEYFFGHSGLPQEKNSPRHVNVSDPAQDWCVAT